jgi:beta-mannosidase
MGPEPAETLVLDLLAGSTWECLSSGPDARLEVADLRLDDPAWMSAHVPGTAAGTLRDLGRWHWGDDDVSLFDGSEWWYRCRFDAPESALEDGPWQLDIDGLATVADVWLNDEHILHSENMWLNHRLRVANLEPQNVLLLRFAALASLLAGRRPRPRWRSLLLRSQNQRWYRTTLLGRVPSWSASAAPVGPWRPIRLRPIEAQPFVAERWLQTKCEGRDGIVAMTVALDGVDPGTTVQIRVGEQVVSGLVVEVDGRTMVETTVTVPNVERWWPHTHGAQPLYPVSLAIRGHRLDLGSVGFRTVEVDRADGAFCLSINGVPIFCRGALWIHPDIVTLDAPETALRASLRHFVEGGMNMLRIGGYTSYEDQRFWDICDELGVLVWQDCMLAGFDPPEEPDFVESVRLEVTQELRKLQGRPSLAVVCGSSEMQQQAAMFGLSRDRYHSPLVEETIPALVDHVLPGMPYVESSPTGGDLPFEPGVGVAHYFGVGAYLRPLSDARLAGVRFAAECLSFGIPPERSTVEKCFAGANVAGHDPTWKAGVARDTGTSWDFEDVRDYYVREVFGVDPFLVRYADAERYLDLGRAVVSHLLSTVMSDWRCAQSSCAGALILSWHDLCPGAGWGLLDSFTVPKAPWYALRRVLAPVATIITDEGLAGLRIHVVNDRRPSIQGELGLTLYNAGGAVVEETRTAIEVEGHSERHWSAADLLGGFRDITNAYRFGPPVYDLVQARLEADNNVSEAFYLPLGAGRPQEHDLGLEAHAYLVGDTWLLTIRTRRFAQWVVVDVPGFVPSDSWFHIAPDSVHQVTLESLDDGDAAPRGKVRALNCLFPSSIVLER